VSAEPKVVVLGLGNVPLGDDAFGPHVVARLEAWHEFPPGVSVQDAGTPGLDLVPYIAGADALIIVDTVRSAGEPGEMRRYRREQILSTPAAPRLTPHDPGLKEALFSLELEGSSHPEVLLVGTIPGQVVTGIGLSEPVRRAVELAEAEVLRELERLGVPARKRVRTSAPDLWWEASPFASPVEDGAQPR
jgi:hydrogenase maturation protease